MNRKIALQPDENILSTLSGLMESFDGTHNVYFGDLVLTNKRLYVVGKKPLPVEESLWFEEETRDVGPSTLIVGEQSVTVKWTYNGNLKSLMKVFQRLAAST
ncbi:hypothetical protein [Bacillus massiliigorillae]|uniref:hypothetical protein n=1 Tax=Bacillus massiliigorillae TaxID=1243664 RepID=UPI0003A535F4|nr:hypothetical protein [Bacillus massiliigorillae]